jgi:hypothetical protein
MNEPILYAGRPHIPPPVYQLRSRKEASTRDTVNARIFEEWQTDGPQNRPDVNGPKVFLDMNPINTRSSVNDYRQSQPYVATGNQAMGANPYFDRYDPTFDPRNAIRELRSAVYEDKPAERAVSETRRFLQRGFTSRWTPDGYVEKNSLDSLLSLDITRPSQDDMKKNYRKGSNQTAPPPPDRASA